MKNKLYIIIVSFFTIPFFAQNVGKIIYGHIESPGKGGPLGLDFNAILVFNNESSYYVTAKDSLENEQDVENQRVKKN